MQTTREYFGTLTVAQLKSILSDFRATGTSRMRKAELINFLLPLFDGAHSDAIAFQAESRYVESLKTVRTVKSYNERMVNRVFGYLSQNGHAAKLGTVEYGGFDSPAMLDCLTPAQRKRYTKKYNRHFRYLSTQLSV